MLIVIDCLQKLQINIYMCYIGIVRFDNIQEVNKMSEMTPEERLEELVQTARELLVPEKDASGGTEPLKETTKATPHLERIPFDPFNLLGRLKP